MAKSRIITALKRIGKSRPKPNTISSGLSKSRRYDNGGKLKTQTRKKSS